MLLRGGRLVVVMVVLVDWGSERRRSSCRPYLRSSSTTGRGVPGRLPGPGTGAGMMAG